MPFSFSLFTVFDIVVNTIRARKKKPLNKSQSSTYRVCCERCECVRLFWDLNRLGIQRDRTTFIQMLERARFPDLFTFFFLSPRSLLGHLSYSLSLSRSQPQFVRIRHRSACVCLPLSLTHSHAASYYIYLCVCL